MSTASVQHECTWHFAPHSDTPGDEQATLTVDGELAVRIIVSELPVMGGFSCGPFHAVEAWIVDQGLPVQGIVADTLTGAVRKIERERLQWAKLSEDQKETARVNARWREQHYGSAYKCRH